MAHRARTNERSPAPAPVNPLWIKAAAGVGVLALVVIGMWRIELFNRRVQIEQRVAENPEVSGWLEKIKSEIEAPTQPADGTAAAEAIWIGTITARPRNRPDGSPPEVVLVRLKPAWLLAGHPSPKDTSSHEVSISIRDFQFPGGEPQLGERWLFAVVRRNGGYNFIRDARHLP